MRHVEKCSVPCFGGDKRLCSQRVGRVCLRTLYCMIYLQKKIDHENATRGGGDYDRHAAGICCLDLPPESLAHMSKNEQALRPAKNIIICRILSRVAYEETPCYLCHLHKTWKCQRHKWAHYFKESVFFLPKSILGTHGLEIGHLLSKDKFSMDSGLGSKFLRSSRRTCTQLTLKYKTTFPLISIP